MWSLDKDIKKELFHYIGDIRIEKKDDGIKIYYDSPLHPMMNYNIDQLLEFHKIASLFNIGIFQFIEKKEKINQRILTNYDLANKFDKRFYLRAIQLYNIPLYQ